MGRLKLPEGDKKKLVTVLIQKKMIDAIDPIRCREIAEEAILKEYKKILKTSLV